MEFILERQAKTSAWGNNCAFNCLAHFLIRELETKSEAELVELYKGPGYKELLQTFSQYFGFPDLTALQLKKLFSETYQHPIDREAILGPVFRLQLGKLMVGKDSAPNRVNREDLWGEFTRELKKYFKTGRTNNFLIQRNQALLDTWKNIYFPDGIKPTEVDDFVKMFEKELKNDWETTYYKNYAKAISAPDSGVTISDLELNILAVQFNIKLRVYSAAQTVIDVPPAKPNEKVLSVFNGGKHWEYEAQSKVAADLHNQHYNIITEIIRLTERLSEVRAELMTAEFTLEDLNRDTQAVRVQQVENEIKKIKSREETITKDYTEKVNKLAEGLKFIEVLKPGEQGSANPREPNAVRVSIIPAVRQTLENIFKVTPRLVAAKPVVQAESGQPSQGKNVKSVKDKKEKVEYASIFKLDDKFSKEDSEVIISFKDSAKVSKFEDTLIELGVPFKKPISDEQTVKISKFYYESIIVPSPLFSPSLPAYNTLATLPPPKPVLMSKGATVKGTAEKVAAKNPKPPSIRPPHAF